MINYQQWKHFVNNHEFLTPDIKIFATTFPMQYPELEISNFIDEPVFAHRGTAYSVKTQQFDTIEELIKELSLFKGNICLFLLWKMFGPNIIQTTVCVRYAVVKSS